MLKFVTENGGLYFGADARKVVAQMRRAEFRPVPRDSNEEYMTAVSRRIGELAGVDVSALEYADEETFLKALEERGLLRPVTEDITCPLAHTLCTARRPECEDSCWLKKAPNGADFN